MVRGLSSPGPCSVAKLESSTLWRSSYKTLALQQGLLQHLITGCWISHLKSSTYPKTCCGSATMSCIQGNSLLKPLLFFQQWWCLIRVSCINDGTYYFAIQNRISLLFHLISSIAFHCFILMVILLILVLMLGSLVQPSDKLLFPLLSLFLILSFAGGIFESSHVAVNITLLVHSLMTSGPNFSLAVFSGLPNSLLHLAENVQYIHISVCLFFLQSRVNSTFSSSRPGCLSELVIKHAIFFSFQVSLFLPSVSGPF